MYQFLLLRMRLLESTLKMAFFQSSRHICFNFRELMVKLLRRLRVCLGQGGKVWGLGLPLKFQFFIWKVFA